ncbi:hypothetical protein WP50_34490, partial [Lactiplantibacillus plantarum]
GFQSLSADMRLQTVLVAFLFGGLIEGVSGFGTPAMVTAPLLIALGFSPMAAVILAVVADATPAAFRPHRQPWIGGLSNVTEISGRLVQRSSPRHLYTSYVDRCPPSGLYLSPYSPSTDSVPLVQSTGLTRAFKVCLLTCGYKPFW